MNFYVCLFFLAVFELTYKTGHYCNSPSQIPDLLNEFMEISVLSIHIMQV